MKTQRHNLLTLLLVISISLLSAVFIIPPEIVSKYIPSRPAELAVNYLPWKLGLDLVGGTALVYEVDLSGANPADYDDIISSLIKVIEKRVNPLGVLEPKVTSARKGDKYQILIELAGVKELKDAVKFIGETPILDFREVKEVNGETQIVPTELTGRHVTSAGLSFDPNTNAPIVNFELNDEGAKLFEDITGRNVNKPLCIFVDNLPIYADPKTGQGGLDASCPIVGSKISGGKAQISGGNTDIASAQHLVGRFKDGALAAPITLINQRTVSASIADDSLNKIIFAGFIGTLAVMLFMIMYYGTFGVFADLALIIYTLVTLAIFKSLSITMTLAGIAGFILSIGMAVDANILIFERTKEELKKGLSRAAAIEEGFKRAWLSIRDSNVSTIITSIILFYFTSSFIKGFALTLLIGVLVSMFSAIFVTRIMLKLFMRNKS